MTANGWISLLVILTSCTYSPIPVASGQLRVTSAEAIMALQSAPDSVQYPMIEISCHGTINISDSLASILNDLRCTSLWIKADSVIIDVHSVPLDSLYNLSISTVVLTTQAQFSKILPNLRLIELVMPTPFESDLFIKGLHTNTLLLKGRFTSTRALATRNLSGTQLLLESPLLISFDSLFLSSLNYGIVNIQGCPLSQRLDSLCPSHEDCYGKLGISDTIVFVF